jgi:translocation and assembly module TamB
MRRIAAIVVVLAGAAIGGLFWFAQSAWLAKQVREFALREMTRVTGLLAEADRVEIGWRSITITLSPLTLHGRWREGEPPLLQARSVTLGIAPDSLRKLQPKLRSVRAVQPEIHVIRRADGTSNLPDRQPATAGAWIDLALEDLTIEQGMAVIGDRQIPLDARLQGVEASARFAPAASHYEGEISARSVEAMGLKGETRLRFELGRDYLRLPSVVLTTAESKLDGAASFQGWSPIQGQAEVALSAAAPDIRSVIGWKGLLGGRVEGALRATLADGSWRVEGPVKSQALTIAMEGRRIEVRQASANLLWGPDGVRFDRLTGGAWGGSFDGSLRVTTSGFQLDGEVREVQPPIGWDAAASGSIHVEGGGSGLRMARADLDVKARPGDCPASGTLRGEYRAPDQLKVELASLRIGDSQLHAHGEVNRSLEFEVRTRDLGDLAPLAVMAGWKLPDPLPVSLDRRLATVSGVVEGALGSPLVRASIQADAVVAGRERAQRVSASLLADREKLRVVSAAALWNGAPIALRGEVALAEWRPLDSSAVHGRAKVSGLAVETLQPHGAGKVAAELVIAGTVQAPTVEGRARVERAGWDGVALGDLEADLAWSQGELRVTNGQVSGDRNQARFTGSATPRSASFAASIGRWRFEKTGALPSAAEVRGAFQAGLVQRNNQWTITRLDGRLDASLDGGRAEAVARTQAGDLRIDGSMEAHGASLVAATRWSLEGNMPGGGEIRAQNLTLPALNWLSGRAPGAKPPFELQAAGKAEIRGALLQPAEFSGRAVFDQIRIAPATTQLPPGFTRADLTLVNEGPVVLSASARTAAIEQARFVAKDTSLVARGSLGFARASAWNLLLEGQVNLAVASTLRPDLVSSGRSTLRARIGGSIAQPDVDGRLEFQDASFYLRDVSNGFDQVNGVIRFDRSRASIESFTAQSGGGNVRLSGFVGFGTEPSYQLQAQLAQVRIRYPEGVSTTANATLNLAGTTRRALLSGAVTILRAGLTPLTDVGGLLAKSANSSLAQPDNELLRSLQYDVRVETAQAAEFSTSLTRNVQADVDLRLRGTYAQPSVLGRISITQGGVQFFGTDYRINRGEVNFVNPVRVEPVADLDLETQVRGITVSITFAGPMNKMKMSYRSDPPLQSSEILALLAVGRTPSAASTLGRGGISGRDLIASGGNAIVNSAVASGGGSSGLQRFFGVTRLKIDPQLIGLDNTPQARVSFEQQISRDVTVTYVQALNRAQQQLVRVEWDFNREWSAIATRDENGVLSVDFVYRRSFR